MRRYLVFRIALAAAAMLDVFIVVYATRELAFDRTFLGIYVLHFVWRWRSASHSPDR